MRKKNLTLLAAFLILCLAQSVSASTISLWEWGFNIDGTISYSIDDNPPVPNTLDADGLSLTWSTSDIGNHFFIAWFDYEINEEGDTWFNEYGEINNISDAEAGQSWEIDEPGWYYGDIYFNFEDNTLDKGNGVPAGSENDVSFAMGWNFSLASGQTADIDLLISQTMPTSGFYLSQTDPDSNKTIYFSSTLFISGTPEAPPIPEPSTLILFVFGLLGSAGVSRRKKIA